MARFFAVPVALVVPSAPDVPLLSRLLAPGLGLVDRIRDLLMAPGEEY